MWVHFFGVRSNFVSPFDQITSANQRAQGDKGQKGRRLATVFSQAIELKDLGHRIYTNFFLKI